MKGNFEALFSIYIFSSYLIVLWCFRRVPDLISVCPKVLNWLLPLAGIGCLPRFEYSKVGGVLNIQRRRRSWIFNPASAIFKSSIQAPPRDQSASHLSAAKAATSDLNICLGFKKELHHYTSRRDFYRFSPQLLLLEKRLYTVSQKRYFLNFVCIVGASLNPLCNPARDTAFVICIFSAGTHQQCQVQQFRNYLFLEYPVSICGHFP